MTGVEPVQRSDAGPRPEGPRRFRRLSMLMKQPGLFPAALGGYLCESLIPFTTHGQTRFFDNRDFPWVDTVEAQFSAIRREVLAILDERHTIPCFSALQSEQAHITGGNAWQTFVLVAFGERVARNCDRCPITAQAISAIPGMTTAMFSILSPGQRLSPHRGPYRGILRYHLGVVIPEQHDKCGIRVADQRAHWRQGQSLIFDDRYDHEAWNLSDEDRVVLFVDFARPLPGYLDTINRGVLKRFSTSEVVTRGRSNLERWYDEVDGARS